MPVNIFLITPPFTQLNTPYPATAYLKGFLQTKQISAAQADLGIDVILDIFNQEGLKKIFSTAANNIANCSNNAQRIFELQEQYTHTINAVIQFLQGKSPNIGYRIASGKFLPQADRFKQLADLTWAFGSMGVTEKAKHIATLYLEDISDFIKECIDENFGFTRYAEKIARCANSFDELYLQLQQTPTLIEEILVKKLDAYIKEHTPQLIAISVPFPGNLFAALRCGKYIKKHYPHIKIALGGGFANTELRSLQDVRIFEMLDFITLDDGEKPLEQLWLYINDKINKTELKRTYLLENNTVAYYNNSTCTDYKQHQFGTPCYQDLPLQHYIQAIEILNPMHSLWSNGRWNKLTMAHGCYWGKCTFCDISLDYIKIYEPVAAALIVDRMQQLIKQTGETGFHFVDEAAPPSLMKAVAIEIIKRKLQVSWWTNIRFEKSFTRDTCLLLKASGCIGVSGGLEVASNRLLQLINKGITVEQVAIVNKNFTEAGIMVHAYLMYGFPTQTIQETIDSAEMVRQMFAAGILQSAFWHKFTMTAHSPVGLHPEKFKVKKANNNPITFADNDVEHIDETGIDHELFTYDLKKLLFNFMHGIGLNDPIHKWFTNIKAPKTTIPNNFIEECLQQINITQQPTAKVVFIGNLPTITIISKFKKGNQWQVAELTFQTLTQTIKFQLEPPQAYWLFNKLKSLHVSQNTLTTLKEVEKDYEAQGFNNFDLFWYNKPISNMYKAGLLVI